MSWWVSCLCLTHRVLLCFGLYNAPFVWWFCSLQLIIPTTLPTAIVLLNIYLFFTLQSNSSLLSFYYNNNKSSLEIIAFFAVVLWDNWFTISVWLPQSSVCVCSLEVFSTQSYTLLFCSTMIVNFAHLFASHFFSLWWNVIIHYLPMGRTSPCAN